MGGRGRRGAPSSGQRPWRAPLPTWRQAGRRLVVTLVEVISPSLSALTFTTCREMGIIDPIFTEQIRLNKLPKLPSYHVVGWRIFPTSTQGQEMTQPWGKGLEIWTRLDVLKHENQGVCVCARAHACLVAQPCPTLYGPTDCTPQAPLSMGFSRQEYWSRLPFPSPGDLSDPGIKPESPPWQAGSLPLGPGAQ